MICVEHLTKYYGTHLAVDDVSFEIAEGHVYGFLGPNGAGKSTTMNIITGCLSATEGRVLIDGHDIFEAPNEAKRCIGYLPEHPPLYGSDSVADYLRFVGQAKGLRGEALRAQLAEVTEKTGLTDVQHRRISQLSKGYQQRVGIAQALLGSPKVIILDEPTVGLDPIQIIEIRELITQLGKTHTVIFSSHILSEVQAICDRILMIAHGKLVAFGTPDELQKQLTAPSEVLLMTDAGEDELRALVGTLGEVTHTAPVSGEPELLRAHVCAGDEDVYALSGAIFRAFAPSGRTIYEMTVRRGSLEDVFLELTEQTEATATETVEEVPETAEETGEREATDE